MKRTVQIPWSLLVMLLVLIFGCSQTESRPATVFGTVQLDGKPVQQGTVLLISDAGNSATAELTSQGAYSLNCVPGDYKFAVLPPPPADPMLKAVPAPTASATPVPPRYRDVGTSGLQTRIHKGENTFNIVLKASAK